MFFVRCQTPSGLTHTDLSAPCLRYYSTICSLLNAYRSVSAPFVIFHTCRPSPQRSCSAHVPLSSARLQEVLVCQISFLAEKP